MKDSGAIRGVRRCLRCGRAGANAFRPLSPSAREGWVCSHEEPCLRRMRVRHRSLARAADGRPRTSPIAPPDLADRLACVIGSDEAGTAVIAEVLAEFAGVEVDRLPPNRRSLDAIRRRDYGVVVIDAQPTDSIAFLNELSRRLGMARRREVATVVIHQDPTSPALDLLCAQARAPRVRRPFDVSALLAAVATATGSVMAQPAAAG